MQAAVIYGLFLGCANFVFTRLLPQPWGAIALWALLTGQMTWAAYVVWQRTRLPFMTASMGFGAVALALAPALAAAGYLYPDIPPAWWGTLGLLAAGMPVCLWAESKRHPLEWERIRRESQAASAWDVIRGRHIPDLRDSIERDD